LRRARPPSFVILAAAASLAGSPAVAQLVTEPCPELCPTPEVSVVALSKRVEVTWPEIEPTVGRSRFLAGETDEPAVSFSQWDFDSSSTVDIIGSYALDCDYRLTISKVPEPTARFGIVPRLRYVIRTNIQGTGAPVASDTLRVSRADSLFRFRETVAGNLGVSISSNVSQPASTLGSVPVTILGLNTSNSKFTTYEIVALNSVSSLSQGLRVRVRGPLQSTNPADTTLIVSAASDSIVVINGMQVSFDADGSVDMNDTVTWAAHYLFPPSATVDVDLEAFEGYHLWRSDLPDVEDFTLLGEIRQCESKFEFVLLSENEMNEIDLSLDYDPDMRVFTAVDRDVHDNFPLRYAVSTFDRAFLGNERDVTFEGPLAKTPKFYPARPERDPEAKAYVYPNPFKKSAPWEERGESRVVFENLPPACTIRVFNAAADHVATLRHGPGEPRSTSNTAMSWNLTSDRGLDLVPGIYIYYIEGAGSFRQTGKMIVSR
jgi:hypothetical protein